VDDIRSQFVNKLSQTLAKGPYTLDERPVETGKSSMYNAQSYEIG